MLAHHSAPAIAIVAIALAVAATGAAYAAARGGAHDAARAGTITVCVRHSGGALYQARRCARHDRRLSWGIQGPQGEPGPQGPAGSNGTNGINGTNGTNGLNGAVAGYSATQPGNVDFTGAASKTILALSLPAGSFIVQAKTAPSAAATSSGYFNDTCTLSDGSSTDVAQVSTPLTLEAFFYVADQVASMEIPVTSATASTVTLACSDIAHSGSSFSTGAADSVITAVQTSANH